MRKFTETVSAIREAKVLALKEKEQAEYAKFFSDKLKKYGVGSPNELSDEEKKKFFEEVDKEWKGTNEEDKIDEGTTPQFKKLIKRAKDLKIETVRELDDLIGDEFDDENSPITGADYEIAKKQLKLDENLELLEEGSELQDAYAEYFKAHMNDHDIKSPSELSEEEKGAFFDKIKSGWVKGKGPKDAVKESEEVNEAIDPKIEGAYDDIFFIWDEFTDDEREGIEGGVTNGKKTLFMTNPPKKFIEKVKKLLDKEGIKHKFTTIGSNQSKLTLDSLIKESEEVNESLKDLKVGIAKSFNPKLHSIEIETSGGSSYHTFDGSEDDAKKFVSNLKSTISSKIDKNEIKNQGDISRYLLSIQESETIKYITFSKPTKHNLIQILEMVSNIDVNPYVTVNDISFKFKDGGMTVAIEETENTEVDKFIAIIEKVLDVKMLETEKKPEVTLNEGISIFEYINTLDISNVDKLRLIEHTSKCYPIPTAPDMIYWEVVRRKAELGIGESSHN